MVRKIVSMGLLIGCLLVASPMQALANQVYNEGNISSTYTVIFEDILHDVSILEDYLLYRSGQNEYTMICGDLELNGTTFSATEYSRYVISYSNGNYGSSSTYDYSVTNGTNFSINAHNYLVYSNLGHYPKLIERSTYYEYATLLFLVIVGLCMLIRPIFKFNYRLRQFTR